MPLIQPAVAGNERHAAGEMKMTTINTALAITVLSMLTPCALTRAAGATTTAQSTAAQTRLQGSWEGVQAGRESAGKYTVTITGNSLRYQAPNPNEWYETTFTLRAGTDPQELHATITDAPGPDHIGSVVVVIFKIEDGTLTLAGLEGPAKDDTLFETEDGDSNLVELDSRPDPFENRMFRFDLRRVQPQRPK